MSRKPTTIGSLALVAVGGFYHGDNNVCKVSTPFHHGQENAADVKIGIELLEPLRSDYA